MARRARIIGLILVATLAPGGCGPQYRTFTSYQPPPGEPGLACVATCLDQKAFCRREKDLALRQCRLEAREEAADRTRDLERAFDLELRRHLAAGGSAAPPEPPAAANPDYADCARADTQLESRCGSDFDICYQTCGGRITHATHCVANCEP